MVLSVKCPKRTLENAIKLNGSSMLQRLRRQISLDYYTIPPATQARLREVRCGAFC